MKLMPTMPRPTTTILLGEPAAMLGDAGVRAKTAEEAKRGAGVEF
jgi:hypothetical protein